MVVIFQTFGQAFIGSIGSPDFYVRIQTQRLSRAFAYFFTLALGLSLITLLGSWNAITGIADFEEKAPEYLQGISAAFPAELKVTIKDGKVSTNVAEPFVIAIPQSSSVKVEYSGPNPPQVDNLIVIDTKTPFSSSQFEKYRTISWLGSDSLYVYGDNEGSSGSAARIQVIPLSNISDSVIDRVWVENILNQVLPWLRVLAPFLIILMALFIYAMVCFKLVYLLVLALLIWPLSQMLHLGLTYGQAYVTGLYAASLGFVITTVAEQLHYPIPFLSVTLLSLGLVAVNLSRTPKKVAGIAN